MDAVIDIIRRSRTVETARKTLRKRFKLSVAQAQAILDMPLRRLAALERKKIIDELKALKRRIRELENLLRSPLKMRKLVAEELGTVKEAHTDRRRTHIIQLEKGKKQASIMSASELVPEKNVWIMVGRNGEIARTLEDKAPRLSGKEAPTWLVKANSRDTLYLVCQDGEAAALPVHSLPEATAPSEGTVFTSITPLRSGKKIGALFTLPSVPGGDKADAGFDDMYVLTVTRQGMVKKSALSDLPGAAANSFTLVKVNDGDELGWLRISNGKNDVLLASAKGMAIRFSEADVRPMGLVAAGVMGMKLQSKDEVVGMDLLPGEGEIFLIASHGIAKRVVPTQFPKQGRYGQGVVAWKLPGKERVAGMTIGKGTARIGVHTSRLQPKTLRLDAAPVQGRTARGRAVIEVKSPSRVTAITIPWETPRPKPKTNSTRKKTKRVKKTSTKKTKK
jgi:DNA gyrase subunit A